MKLLAAFLLFATAQAAYALTSAEIFADGNRLFRDELPWAALARYRQANEAGMDTPVLHYNMGVAYFKTDQHERAHESLLRAMQEPNLRIISQYNLGLNAYAGGDVDKALEWFRQARDQEQDRKIRRLAIIAISRLQEEIREEDVLVQRSEKRIAAKKVADLSLIAFAGFGTDDNVYRTPSDPYFDFTEPTFPLVTPEVMSGTFVPVDFRARYSINSYQFESFYAAYRMAGRYYTDTEIENANEFSHELSFGSSYRSQKETRNRHVFSAFTFAQHEETYFDPDDGTINEVDDGTIEDRMNYKRYGPEIAWVQAYSRFAFGARFKGQIWNYDDTKFVPEYDHEYFLFAAHAQYEFTKTSLLRLTVDKYSRRYSDRPAFDLGGRQPPTNPDLRYDYLAVGVTARQRIMETMWFGFTYERTDRQDRYLGYNDYTRDEYGFDFQWTPGLRWKFEAAGYYRNYDYPNAFAYHNPLAGIKTLETVRANLLAEYKLTKHISLRAEAELRDNVSTDARIQYDRSLFSLGVTWKQ